MTEEKSKIKGIIEKAEKDLNIESVGILSIVNSNEIYTGLDLNRVVIKTGKDAIIYLHKIPETEAFSYEIYQDKSSN